MKTSKAAGEKPHMVKTNSPIVSFDDEPLILVDSSDNEIGYQSKDACHRGNGALHRAFSVFVFNGENQLLLQQRSAQKPLWPLYWSNSCCSHPRRGEQYSQSVKRRLREELAIESEPQFLYRFSYHAAYEDVGAEHELCSVYIAPWDGEVSVNANEVADWLFVEPEELDKDLAENPQRYTPWFILEWSEIRKAHWEHVQKLDHRA